MAIEYQRFLKGYDFKQPADSEWNINHIQRWSEYTGLCIEIQQEFDDLYMIVWDVDTNQPKRIKYGCTRLPSNTTVDAPNTLKEQYTIWKCEEELRKFKDEKNVVNKIIRDLEMKAMSKFNMTYKSLSNLRDRTGDTRYILCLKLIVVNFRSLAYTTLQQRIVRYITEDKTALNPFTIFEWNIIKKRLSTV